MVPDCLALCAGAEVALHLGLVHAVQRQHEEDPAHRQSPERVSLRGVGVQTEEKQAAAVLGRRGDRGDHGETAGHR